MDVKTNFRIMTNNNAANPKKGPKKNLFYSRWDSTSPPDRLGVDELKF